MSLFVVAPIVFLLAFAGMAIGVLLRNRSIRGSCGGLGTGEEGEEREEGCRTCSIWAPRCRSEREGERREDHEETRAT